MYRKIIIKWTGVECYCDKCIISEYYYTPTIALASIFGHESMVKAVSSGIINGKEATLEDTEYENLTRAYSSFEIKGRKLRLPSGAEVLHQIVYSPQFFKTVTFYRTEEEKINKIFKIVDRYTDVPLIQEWAEEIYHWLLSNEHLDELITYGTDEKAVRVIIPHDSDLEDLIKKIA